jgi:hypothetical protein
MSFDRLPGMGEWPDFTGNVLTAKIAETTCNNL